MIFNSKIEEAHNIVFVVSDSFTIYCVFNFYNIRIAALTTVVHRPSLFPSADCVIF
jgi:hypothetical protein